MPGNSIASRFFQSAAAGRKRQLEESTPQFPTQVVLGDINNPLIVVDDDDSDDAESVVTHSESKKGKLSSSDHETFNWNDDESNLLDKTTTTTTTSGSSTITTGTMETTGTQLPLPPVEEQDSSPRQHTNPFAQFAFQQPSDGPIQPGLSWRLSNKTNTLSTNSMMDRIQGVTCSTTKEPQGNKHHMSYPNKTNKTNKQKTKKKECEFVPMRKLPQVEQDKITQKWHSLADPSAPLEIRRFQILVAARLHARCQEPSVRKAMAVLREAFSELTVSTVAKADPDVLAHYITNLQYYNVKAKHLVKAAREIQVNYNGIVPEDEASLLQITGVGKVFADLLAFVNTRKAHESVITQCTSTPEPSNKISTIQSNNTGPN